MSEHGAATNVVQCDNDSVLVSLPMRGFPPGFRLRAGEKVMVMVEGTELVARPLVEMFVVSESSEELTAQQMVNINGQSQLLQTATVSDRSGKPNQGALVFTIDPGSASGPKQIVAVRPR